MIGGTRRIRVRLPRPSPSDVAEAARIVGAHVASLIREDWRAGANSRLRMRDAQRLRAASFVLEEIGRSEGATS
jgi:hypothetical protein